MKKIILSSVLALAVLVSVAQEAPKKVETKAVAPIAAVTPVVAPVAAPVKVKKVKVAKVAKKTEVKAVVTPEVKK